MGSYAPIRNSDKTIVGMIFVGKSRHIVVETIAAVILRICLFLLVTVAAVIGITMAYSKHIIYALNKTKEFLKSISSGNLNAKMAPYLLKRKDELGEMGRFAVIFQESITNLVGTDPLTGLRNRRSGGIVLKNLIQEKRKHQIKFVLAIGDIDWFKEVNDRYGHQAGDLVLKQLAKILSEHMERKGFIFRWGGEEFLFLYENMDRQEVRLAS